MHPKIKLQRSNKSGIIKKFSPEILKFERLLKKIGYYDNAPIIKNLKKIEESILEKYKNEFNIELVAFIKYYPNKKSYIWNCYQEMIIDISLPRNKIIKYIHTICKGIIFTEKTRIAEVGWKILYSHNLTSKSKKDLTILYLRILKDLKVIIKKELCGISPNPGDILIGRPRGLKFGAHNFNTEEEGSRQRALSSQKMFNFGKVNEWGDQYARYDEDLNLHPT